ncbi:MAG: PH domain-containing protein, partial [Phycisphaerales bacterium JB039]
MSAGDRAGAWVYRGVWAALADWLLVPREAPTLPAAPGDTIRSFRPAPGFLRYLKFWFWIVLALIDIAITALWLVVLIASPIVGIALAPLWLIIAIVPDIFAYVGIHLRYDTTWYVLSPRSMRVRRGIWSIQEATITYENIQNVAVTQGPVQRHFGIASVTVQTAGGGGATGPHGSSSGGHTTVLEGLENRSEER